MSGARPKDTAWTPLPAGPYEGKTLPEVLFQDPDFVIFALDAGAFDSPWQEEAKEVCRRASRIRPVRGSRREVTVLYHLNAYCPTQFSGISVVAKNDGRLAEYRQVSAAESAFLDLTMPRRLAPADPGASRGLVERVLFTHFGKPDARLTRQQQAEVFFADPRSIGGVE